MFWGQGLNPLPGPVGGRGGRAAAQSRCPHRPRDTSATCMKISVMATTSSPSWRCSLGTAWCVYPPTPACLWGWRLPFTRIPLPAFLSWGLSYMPTPRPAWPKPLPCLPAWSVGPSLGVAPSPRASGSWPCCSLCRSPDTVTSRSALLWFLCCLDCELWPLPFTLCLALAGQPRERDVIRSSRLVSGCPSHVLATAARGLPEPGSPAHLGLVAILDRPVPGAWAGRWLCMQLPAVLPVAVPRAGPGTPQGCHRHPGGPLPQCHCPPPAASWLLSPPTPSFLPTAWAWLLDFQSSCWAWPLGQ